MRVNIEDAVVHAPGPHEKPSFIFRPTLKQLLEELGTYKVDCTACERNGRDPEQFCNYCLFANNGVNYYKEKRNGT